MLICGLKLEFVKLFEILKLRVEKIILGCEVWGSHNYLRCNIVTDRNLFGLVFYQ